MSAFDKMGFWCEACGKMRPNAKIAVRSYPIPSIPGAVRNYNYCNDDPECIQKSLEKAAATKL